MFKQTKYSKQNKQKPISKWRDNFKQTKNNGYLKHKR